MNAEEWKAYLDTMQGNRAIDPVSLAQYASLVASLNVAVREAAGKHLGFENEPAQFAQLLRELSK